MWIALGTSLQGSFAAVTPGKALGDRAGLAPYALSNQEPALSNFSVFDYCNRDASNYKA